MYLHHPSPGRPYFPYLLLGVFAPPPARTAHTSHTFSLGCLHHPQPGPPILPIPFPWGVCTPPSPDRPYFPYLCLVVFAAPHEDLAEMVWTVRAVRAIWATRKDLAEMVWKVRAVRAIWAPHKDLAEMVWKVRAVRAICAPLQTPARQGTEHYLISMLGR